MQLSLYHLIPIFLAEVFVLYRLSHILIQSIGRKVANLTHSRRITMYVLALLFLPGTVLHELSHWIVARVLMVRTGEVILWPRMEAEGFRLGSVAIASTDTLRRFFIGAAPFLVGVTIMLGTIWIVINQESIFWWHYLLAVYSVFEIGNTMFSSKKDLEGTGLAVIFLFAVVVSLYLLGFSIPADFATQLYNILTTAIAFLLVPILIDLALVLFSKVL